MEKNKRILIICPYPVGVAAGQRLKYEQYIGDWQANGYQIDISPYMRMPMWNIVHKSGNHFSKILYTVEGIFKRAFEIFKLRKYDLIYVHMYVTPIGTSFFERIYRVLSKKMIFDLEDNRFLGASKETSGIAQLLRSIAKTSYLVRKSDHVITSSPALNDFCLELNRKRKCTYISSSINTERFVPNNTYSNDRKITIGWTGTFSTRPYLDLLRPVFIELKKIRDFKLLVIGNFEYSFPEMDIEVLQWSAETEVEDLQKMDIGVYPLPTDSWVMGKSGLKAIQYMSFGLPCISTDVSTVQRFIRNNENGFLVTTDEEWVAALVNLIDNPDTRKRVGENARRTVLEKFSTDVVKKQYLAVLRNTIST
ncbi:glycosyltransferase family 4 protein [Ferruginibacter sp. SUN002]|uniref:glycosyltransferase family 4 protein n=1 Tax=Ferruginibacter sp. SUN002 TaxID=2937789 RepID=UPI003D36A700